MSNVPQSPSEEILRKIEQAGDLYHRLVLVVAPSGSGKTSALQEAQRRTGAPLLNVNLELSRRLLDLTQTQRALRVPQLLADIVGQAGGQIVLLDNIEILFEASLRQDPLRLLQGISRNLSVVAAWNGSAANGYLIYAAPGHPEYRRCLAKDLLLVVMGDALQDEATTAPQEGAQDEIR